MVFKKVKGENCQDNLTEEALLMTSDKFGGDGDEDFEINEDDDVNVYYVEVFVCLFLKFYPHIRNFITSLKVCLSQKISTFQEGSYLTPLYPSLISLTPLGHMRHSKSLYPQEGQWGAPGVTHGP